MKSKLRSRKFWFTVITDLSALAAALVPMEYQDLVIEASVRLGGLITAALVTMGYLWTEGKIDECSVHAEGRLKELREQADQMREQRRHEANQQANQTTSKAHAWPALLVMAAMFSGCAIFNPDLTPEDRWHTARDALTTAQDIAVQQWRTGNLSDRELVTVDEHLGKVGVAMQVARDRLDSNEPAADTLGLIEEALDALIEAAQAGDFEDGQLEAVTDPLPTENDHEPSESDSAARGGAVGGGVYSLDRPGSRSSPRERGDRRKGPRGHHGSGGHFGFPLQAGGGRSPLRIGA